MSTLLALGSASGYAGLADVLSMLGIKVTPDGLETLGRRFPLPRQGGGLRGRPVWFSRDDVDHWLWHLTGVTLSERRAQIHEDGTRDPQFLRRIRRSRCDSTPQWEFPRPLYVVTHRTQFGEQVFRDEDGYAHAWIGDAPFDGFPDEGPRAATAACWRYDRVRRSKPGDLVAPHYAKRRRRELPASTLVGAVEKNGARWRFARVQGEWFGLDKGATTPVILSNRHPWFESLIAAFRRRDPDTVFVAWTARVAVAPVTFEPRRPTPPPRGLT